MCDKSQTRIAIDIIGKIVVKSIGVLIGLTELAGKRVSILEIIVP